MLHYITKWLYCYYGISSFTINLVSYRILCCTCTAYAFSGGCIATCGWINISSMVNVKRGAIKICVVPVSAALKLEEKHKVLMPNCNKNNSIALSALPWCCNRVWTEVRRAQSCKKYNVKKDCKFFRVQKLSRVVCVGCVLLKLDKMLVCDRRDVYI